MLRGTFDNVLYLFAHLRNVNVHNNFPIMRSLVETEYILELKHHLFAAKEDEHLAVLHLNLYSAVQSLNSGSPDHLIEW
jgi:hypothetical protein